MLEITPVCSGKDKSTTEVTGSLITGEGYLSPERASCNPTPASSFAPLSTSHSLLFIFGGGCFLYCFEMESNVAWAGLKRTILQG